MPLNLLDTHSRTIITHLRRRCLYSSTVQRLQRVSNVPSNHQRHILLYFHCPRSQKGQKVLIYHYRNYGNILNESTTSTHCHLCCRGSSCQNLVVSVIISAHTVLTCVRIPKLICVLCNYHTTNLGLTFIIVQYRNIIHNAYRRGYWGLICAASHLCYNNNCVII